MGLLTGADQPLDLEGLMQTYEKLRYSRWSLALEFISFYSSIPKMFIAIHTYQVSSLAFSSYIWNHPQS